MSLRAVIVDDERLARKRLRELLAVHPEITVVAEAADLDSALTAVAEHRPDVLFLDVELSPDNGMDLLPRLKCPPLVIFITAHESFAVRAFTINAFDYLLKPVHPDRLTQTVHRLREQIPPSPPADLDAFPASACLGLHDRITLKDAGVIRVVEVGRIAVIRAAGAYSRVLLRGLPPMFVLRSISVWEKLLPAEFFSRLDRSFILQRPLLRAVERVSRDQSRLLIDGLPERLLIGRAAVRRLKRTMPALF